MHDVQKLKNLKKINVSPVSTFSIPAPEGAENGADPGFKTWVGAEKDRYWL